jgi:hypothetical protein
MNQSVQSTTETDDLAAVITRQALDVIEELRAEAHREEGTLLVCREVSTRVERRFGWWAEVGHYTGPGGGARYGHWWNRLPGGAILDATADQFGFSGVRVVAPGDPAQFHYENDTGEDDEDGYMVTRYRPYDGRDPRRPA